MTREKAIEVLKSECYVLPFLDGDRAALINTALDVAIEALKQDVLDKIKAEIEKAVWEDILPISDGTGEIIDEIRTPLLNPDDVFEIIDKYKAESEG